MLTVRTHYEASRPLVTSVMRIFGYRDIPEFPFFQDNNRNLLFHRFLFRYAPNALIDLKSHNGRR